MTDITFTTNNPQLVWSSGSMVLLHGTPLTALRIEGDKIRSVLHEILEKHPHSRVTCPHERRRGGHGFVFATLELDFCDQCLDALFTTSSGWH